MYPTYRTLARRTAVLLALVAPLWVGIIWLAVRAPLALVVIVAALGIAAAVAVHAQRRRDGAR